jgi:hypothetical protein
VTYAIRTLRLGVQPDGVRAGMRVVRVEFASGPAERGARCYDVVDLVVAIVGLFGVIEGAPTYAVLAGDEPTRQADATLIEALRGQRVRVCLETDGTTSAPRGVNWVTLRPRPGGHLVVRKADELVCDLPGGWSDEALAQLAEAGRWDQMYVAPEVVDVASVGPRLAREVHAARVEQCVQHVLAHPRWRVSARVQETIAWDQGEGTAPARR